MKRTFLTLSIAAITALSACTSKNSDNTTAGTENTPSDTIEIAETPTPETPVFISDDLKELGLKGNVKSVTQKWDDYSYPCIIDVEEFKFDENGKRTSPKVYEYYRKITRNSDGFMVSNIFYPASDGTSLTTEFVLDENGRPVSAKSEMVSPEEEYIKNLTFSYPENDAKGNWTKCIIKIDETEYIATRIITYYE